MGDGVTPLFIEGARYAVHTWVMGTSYGVYAWFIITVELTVIGSCWIGR